MQNERIRGVSDEISDIRAFVSCTTIRMFTCFKIIVKVLSLIFFPHFDEESEADKEEDTLSKAKEIVILVIFIEVKFESYL